MISGMLKHNFLVFHLFLFQCTLHILNMLIPEWNIFIFHKVFNIESKMALVKKKLGISSCILIPYSHNVHKWKKQFSASAVLSVKDESWPLSAAGQFHFRCAIIQFHQTALCCSHLTAHNPSLTLTPQHSSENLSCWATEEQNKLISKN